MSSAVPPSAPAVPSRRRRWPRVLVWVAVLFVLLQGGAYLALPGVIQREAASWAQGIGYRLQLQTVRVLPWQLRVELGPWRLSDAHGETLAQAEGTQLDARFWPLLLGRYQIEAFAMTAPQLTLSRNRAGSWNWVRFIDAARGSSVPAADDAPLPRLLVEDASLARGRVVVHDAFGPAGLRTREARDLNLTLREVSTESAGGGYQLSARLGPQAQIRWQGRLSLAPLASDGKFSVQALPLASVWPWLGVPLAPPQGQLALASHYRFSLSGPAPQLQLDGLRGSLRGLVLQAPGSASRLQLDSLVLAGGKLDLASRQASLVSLRLDGATVALVRDARGQLDWLRALPPGAPPTRAAPAAQTPGWALTIGKLDARAVNYRYRDHGFVTPLTLAGELAQASAALRVTADGGVQLNALGATLRALTLGAGDAAAPLTVQQLQWQGARADLARRELQLGALRVDGLALDVVRERGGALNLVRLLRRVAAPAAPAAVNAPPGAPWRITYPAVQLAASQVRWQDQTLARPVTLALTDLGGTLAYQAPTLDAQLEGAVGSAGQVRLHASVAEDVSQAQAQLTLREVGLAPLAPYLLAGTPLRMQGGALSAELGARWQGGDQFRVDGQARVGPLSVFEPGQARALLAWRALSVHGLRADARQASIGELTLDRPQARFILDAQRVSNVQRLFAGAGENAGAAPANKPFPLFVRTVRVRAATLDFADLGMQPVFGTRIHNLSGSVLGLSSLPGRRGTVSLAGEVDEYGDVRIRGALQPFALTDDLDLQLAFRNIPIHSLNPYSMSFAGWKVDDGRLSADLSYRLAARQLSADNRVVIKSLKLGDELPDYQGTRLPLRLAVALLEDGDGVIDLDLPVSGSLDDPQFSTGHLVWQALKNVIVKVATAPFRALAALLGGEGFDAVYAVPGEAAVSPPEREKLAKLAQLMAKRPQLALTLAGGYDPRADRAELARARIDRAVLQQAGYTLTADTPLPLPDSGDPAIAKATRALYGERIGRLKLVQRLLALPDTPERTQTLRKELIAAEQVGEPELKALANARAAAARRALLDSDASLAPRVRLGDAVAGKADANGVALGLKLDRSAPSVTAPSAANAAGG